MNKKAFLIILSVVILLLSTFSFGAIPAQEREALIALYNATNGDNWSNNNGWKGNNNEADGFSEIGTEGTWFGINVRNNHVAEIELADKNLNGSIPEEIGNLSDLEYLNLNNNKLIGTIPSTLANLSKLNHLWLGANQLNGSIPVELGNLKNLQYLDLGGNQLTGNIPSELGKLTNLILLELDDCKLTGNIPLQFLNLINLQYLQLGNNQLNGTIPAGLGSLKNLRGIELSQNQLTGIIPVELTNLNNLQYLELGDNPLTGNIPPELGSLSNLLHLFLNNTQLTGYIPEELGNLNKLEILWLNSTQLIGSIPYSLINLTNLSPSHTYIGYNGLYTNNNTLRNFLNSKDSDWEETQTIAPKNLAATPISNSSIKVSWTPIKYTSNSGGYKVYYSTTSGDVWIYSGMTTNKSASSYNITGLNPGTTYYFVVKTQTDAHENNQNTIVSEYSEETFATTQSLPETDPPFGSFETPINSSIVASSIPVTGWALDDTGIDHVKIYRAQGNSLNYIGDAVLVEGARPDVAEAFPGYPNNTKAGWGYMMLTNFLPNNGNGTFVIHAIATDLIGKTTILGTKTIHCDNANAVKPFGAIDTPTQGGTASGSNFINWGWVLTPQPNSIPIDGTTINVYVDGVNVGHPTYNIYRSDIANLFPDYSNSNGAIGYFYLDTTSYENGVHTIQWTAKDSGGNSDGIGSRYFIIQNSGNSQSKALTTSYRKIDTNQEFFHLFQIVDILLNDSESIRIKRGLRDDIEPEVISCDESGVFIIKIEELERLVIEFSKKSAVIEGYTIVENQLKLLPIGSIIDSKEKKFYWQPGPGFVGYYRIVFIERSEDNQIRKKNIIVNIEPNFTK